MICTMLHTLIEALITDHALAEVLDADVLITHLALWHSQPTA